MPRFKERGRNRRNGGDSRANGPSAAFLAALEAQRARHAVAEAEELSRSIPSGGEPEWTGAAPSHLGESAVRVSRRYVYDAAKNRYFKVVAGIPSDFAEKFLPGKPASLSKGMQPHQGAHVLASIFARESPSCSKSFATSFERLALARTVRTSWAAPSVRMVCGDCTRIRCEQISGHAVWLDRLRALHLWENSRPLADTSLPGLNVWSLDVRTIGGVPCAAVTTLGDSTAPSRVHVVQMANAHRSAISNTYTAQREFIHNVCWMEDAKLVIAASRLENSGVLTLATDGSTIMLTALQFTSDALAVCVAPNATGHASSAYFGKRDGNVVRMDARSGRSAAELKMGSGVTQLESVAEWGLLTASTQLMLYDIRRVREPVYTYRNFSNSAADPNVSVDGSLNFIAARCKGGTIRCWSTQKESPELETNPFNDAGEQLDAACVAFVPQHCATRTDCRPQLLIGSAGGLSILGCMDPASAAGAWDSGSPYED